MVVVGSVVGCGASAVPPPVSVKSPPLSLEEWRRMEDLEEKYNRHTLQRLPKDDRRKAIEMMNRDG
jgi:hypothetical protein